MSEMKYENILKKLYGYLKEGYMAPVVGRYLPPKATAPVHISLGNYGSSFSTYDSKKSAYHVVIDKGFFFGKVKEQYYPVDDAEKRQIVHDTMMYAMGLFYHEYGHVLFTSFMFMDYVKDIPVEHLDRVKYLFNILEDPLIEAQIKAKIRRARPYLNYLVDKLFVPMGGTYSDSGDTNSLFSYLLLALRIGRKNISGSCAFYDKHAEKINEYVSRYYRETDGEKRPFIVKEFYEFLLSEGIDFSTPVEDKSCSTVSSVGTPGSSGSGSSGTAPSAGTSRSAGSLASDRLGEEDGPKSPDSTDITKEELESSKIESSDDFVAPSYDGFESYDAFASGTSSHEFVPVRDIASITDESKLLDKYNSTVVKFSDVVYGCMEQIDSFNSLNRVEEIPGFQSGKFNLKSFVKDEPILKCFSRPNGYDVSPDLCFYCMVDNSGSMTGSKSSICAQAMIVLYECLSRLDLPFELSAFTNDGDYAGTHCLSYVIKSFDDDAESHKVYVPMNDYSYVREYNFPAQYKTFYGNYDEVNFAFCAERLLARSNKDKVMIVLSDGETCGSIEVLREEVRKLEDEGVLVLGIGMCCSTVTTIYKNNVVFSSSSDLEGLSDFLGKFLVELYTNK